MKSKCKLSRLFTIILLCLNFSLQLSAQTLKAVNDTIDLYPGIVKTFNLLENDTVPFGDSLKVTVGIPSTTPITETNNYRGFFTFLVKTWGFYGNPAGTYTIHDYTINKYSSGHILFKIHDHSYDSLDINNVKAAITSYGNQFFLPGSEVSIFRIPKDGQTGTFFNSSLWIGGKGNDSTLYFAGEMYKQGPLTTSPYWSDLPDFYAGPVMDSVDYSVYQDTIWSRTWKVKKSEIEYHKTHWNSQGYIAPANILNWPGNGNTTYGQAAELAPYHDNNGDGKYNAADGDYPLIMGDEAIYTIYNDDRDVHKDSGGKKMKLEIHLMAYAFDLPDDSAFKNTIFLNYKIFNRSSRTYYNTYLGVWADPDIGYSLDDYIGCDVGRSSIIGFNGKAVDGTGEATAYGAHPPAQSVTILGGPFMDPGGHDRPRFDHQGHQICNESINGTGFGDGIANNERYGLTNFLGLWNYTDQSYDIDPTAALQYYLCMQSNWRDTTHLLYGGQGHEGHGGYGPECRFMFPGESDSLNWGPGCQLPNGPVNWTEYTANIPPYDIRGIGGMGPFTFHPGDVQELDLALVFARDYTSQDTVEQSVAKLRQMIDTIRKSYITGKLPNGTSFFGIENQPTASSASLKIYPNPANETINLLFDRSVNDLVKVQIINISGVEVFSLSLVPSGRKVQLDASGLAGGIYIINIQAKDFTTNGKAIIVR